MKSCVTLVYFSLFLSRNHGFKRPTLGNNKQLYFRDSGRKYQHKDEGEILDFYLFLAKSIGLKSR